MITQKHLKHLSTLTLMAAITGIGSASAVFADIVNLNIVNPGFESGTANTPGAPGWAITTGTNATHFWTSNGSGLLAPDPSSGQGPSSLFLTAHRFTEGELTSNPMTSLASQAVDISTFASDIDGGGVTIDLDFYFNNTEGGAFQQKVVLQFFDAGNTSLGTLTSVALPTTAIWVLGGVNGAVPTNARTVEIQITAGRSSGSATNVSFDNFSGTLDGVSAIPEPSSIALLGLGVAVVMGRRSRRKV